ncbi:DNA mismatch repair MutS family like protein [Aduncisulcus paluster]|uniref:DNA mismatch repair MutS family like protein n=1 Tax=Aduncisulcus paluster TaxID=2918883 RepID=A0ABQ5K6B1_9EUKA|nr:DNA mismatch repair MutS family like protein [Aduncisulcus paluster]
MSYFNTLSLISCYEPVEILFPTTSKGSHLLRLISPHTESKTTYSDPVSKEEPNPGTIITLVPRSFFNPNQARVLLKERCSSLPQDIDSVNTYLAFCAAAALIHSVELSQGNQFRSSSLIISTHKHGSHMLLDSLTVRHLELLTERKHAPVHIKKLQQNVNKSLSLHNDSIGIKTSKNSSSHKSLFSLQQNVNKSLSLHNDSIGIKTSKNSSSHKSLFSVLNYCKTVGGKRMLRSNLLHPPCDSATILARQEAITELLSDETLFFAVVNSLPKLGDCDRALSAISRSSLHPTPQTARFTALSLLTLRTIVSCAPTVSSGLYGCKSPLLCTIRDTLSNTDLVHVCNTIEKILLSPQENATAATVALSDSARVAVQNMLKQTGDWDESSGDDKDLSEGRDYDEDEEEEEERGSRGSRRRKKTPSTTMKKKRRYSSSSSSSSSSSLFS